MPCALRSSRDPFFHRVQIVTDAPLSRTSPLRPSSAAAGDNTVFVDIESKIEFFFHWCVCLFELFKLQRSRNTCAPVVGAALLHLKKEE